MMVLLSPFLKKQKKSQFQPRKIAERLWKIKETIKMMNFIFICMSFH